MVGSWWGFSSVGVCAQEMGLGKEGLCKGLGQQAFGLSRCGLGVELGFGEDLGQGRGWPNGAWGSLGLDNGLQVRECEATQAYMLD